MLLSRSQYARARNYVEAQGRALDAARLRTVLDGAPPDAVWEALAAYQNADGGYGHALEPDLRLGESSAVATTVALQIMQEVGAAPPEAMLRAAIGYLLATFDATQGIWRIVPRCAPCDQSPWWNDAVTTDDNLFGLNPTAEILGHLTEHADLVPGAFLSAVAERVATHVLQHTTADMEELMGWVRLVDAKGLDALLRQRLIAWLTPHVTDFVAHSREDWARYGLRPLDVATRPASPFADALQAWLPDNLDYEIETQAPDGAWDPTWTWGEGAQGWPVARHAWRSVRTTQRLLMLKAWGRIA